VIGKTASRGIGGLHGLKNGLLELGVLILEGKKYARQHT